MDETVTNLSEDTFLEFLAQSTPVVVFLSIHPWHAFNQSLPEHLHRMNVQGTNFGQLSLSELALTRSQALQFLVQARVRAALPQRALSPGYYLFFESELLAFHAGLPNRADINTLLKGAAVGAVWYGLTRDTEQFVQSVVSAANAATAPQIADALAKAFHSRDIGAQAPHAHSRPPTASDLRWAYSMLGVDDSASDEQVNAAWRKLRAANHPDHAESDSDEFTRRTRLSKELNRARDVILAHRSRRRAAA